LCARGIRRSELGRRAKQQRPNGPILIKRYGPSRLYHALEGRYVSVDELRRWRAEGIAFRVQDARTGKNVTIVVLA
jgi:polyhydroxyalkanoate synthesis regulator protein